MGGDTDECYHLSCMRCREPRGLRLLPRRVRMQMSRQAAGVMTESILESFIAARDGGDYTAWFREGDVDVMTGTVLYSRRNPIVVEDYRGNTEGTGNAWSISEREAERYNLTYDHVGWNYVEVKEVWEHELPVRIQNELNNYGRRP